MARVKYSDLVNPIQGKHFGYTFQGNYYGKSVFPAQRNKRTRYPNQSKRQQNLQKAVRQWRNMTPGTVVNWNAFAAAYQQPTKRNPLIFLTGYQLFIKRNHYCFLNHGIDTDFMLAPAMENLTEGPTTFELKAGNNMVDVTEQYIKNFGILPEPGQWLELYAIPYSDVSGQFFPPIIAALNVEEVYFDGLFLNLVLPTGNQNITYSVYLSKPMHPGSNYGGTKIRYMGCSTTKTFLGLTDTPASYTGQAGKIPVVKVDESGLEFDVVIQNATHTGEVTGATALTISPKAVTLAKMADMATASLIYRKTAGTGVPEVNTLAILSTDLGITGATNAWVEKAPKLGDETYILSLAVFNNKLYGGTIPNGKLYEWNNVDAWVEKAPKLGAETDIRSMAVFNNKLYGGTAGNGKLYEWNNVDAWVEKAPKLGAETQILSMAVFNNKLYAGTTPNGKLYKWNNIDAWVEKAPKLGAENQIFSLAVFNNKLYGGTQPSGKLYEWNGVDAWVEKAPKLGDETYILSLAVFNNKLYGGTIPNGKLYEWNNVDAWVEKAPKLGAESQITSLAVLNNKLYGGTIPNGKLYEWNNVGAWVEKAPKLGDETYILSLAVFNNKLYGGTYPNSKLYEWNGSGLVGMAYPGVGIPLSQGAAWGTSIPNNSANWDAAYLDRLKWDGGATGLVAATGRDSLGGTTVGQAFFALANPDAITYVRINADNSVTLLSAPDFRAIIANSPFQMLIAKDITAGTAQSYDLLLKCREAITINSIIVECDTGTLTGCSVTINGTAITLTGPVTTFSFSDTLTEIAAISDNVASAGNRIKVTTTAGFTGTPTAIRIQLNYTKN